MSYITIFLFYFIILLYLFIIFCFFKTELILIGTRQQLGKINDVCNICLGDYDIYPSSCVRNLGAWFDKLSMSRHVTKICNAAFYHLHNISRIKKYLSGDSLLTLIHAFITSR